MENITNNNINRLLSLLKTMRIAFSTEENQIHAQIMDLLKENNIEYKHEHQIGPRARVDFLVGNIGIEVKKSKPQRASLINQLKRYSENHDIYAIIVVVEKGIKLPSTINGKAIHIIDLNSQWGIAL